MASAVKPLPISRNTAGSGTAAPVTTGVPTKNCAWSVGTMISALVETMGSPTKNCAWSVGTVISAFEETTAPPAQGFEAAATASSILVNNASAVSTVRPLAACTANGSDD